MFQFTEYELTRSGEVQHRLSVVRLAEVSEIVVKSSSHTRHFIGVVKNNSSAAILFKFHYIWMKRDRSLVGWHRNGCGCSIDILGAEYVDYDIPSYIMRSYISYMIYMNIH